MTGSHSGTLVPDHVERVTCATWPIRDGAVVLDRLFSTRFNDEPVLFNTPTGHSHH